MVMTWVLYFKYRCHNHHAKHKGFVFQIQIYLPRKSIVFSFMQRLRSIKFSFWEKMLFIFKLCSMFNCSIKMDYDDFFLSKALESVTAERMSVA